MSTWRRQTGLYVLGLLGVMGLFTVAYYFGMEAYEGVDTSWLHALQVVVETFTTTGFGSDAPWTSPQMNVLVILMDLTGVILIFLALPVLLFPLFEEAIESHPPRTLEERPSDHVVACAATARTRALLADLDSRGVEAVVVEADEERAQALDDEGHTVLHADPERAESLEAAGLEDARALVADASDPVDASIVLAAREVTEETPVISVIERPEHARYHRLAGADDVVAPRHLLGGSLARKVTAAVRTDLGDAVSLGEDFEIVELPIEPGSELVGETLADVDLGQRRGVNVVGTWMGGRFESPPSADATLDSETVLLVSGPPARLEELKGRTRSESRRVRRGDTVGVGYGEAGQAVVTALEDAGVPNTVVDEAERPAVDVVGDATEPETLEAAGVDEATAVVLAVPDDTVTEFAALVVTDRNPDAELLARVEEPESTRKVYRAGADYALALSTVFGRMLASRLLDGEEVITPGAKVKVVRVEAGDLAGLRLGEADVRARTGATVVAVERDGAVITELGPETAVHAGDTVVVAGTDAGVRSFSERFH